MKYTAKIVALATATSAATITLQDPVDDLIYKGIDKVAEDAQKEVSYVLFDLIQAEYEDGIKNRRDVLQGMREACYA